MQKKPPFNLHVVVDNEMYEKLRQAAHENYKPMAEIIREALKEFFKKK